MERSGARRAKRTEGAGDLEVSVDLASADVGTSGALGAGLSEANSVRLRCASRMASISAQRFVNAVETFFWPVARCLFKSSLLDARRSSRCKVWI